jgi:phosphonate transport system substrate-binding protein
MSSRRRFLLKLLFLLTACKTAESPKRGKLSVGVVSYGEGDRSIEQYSAVTDYLGTQLKTLVELEPVYNEVKALEQIQRRAWSLVFAPPGLAAIAISEQQYLPLLPLEGIANARSVIVVLQDSPLKNLADLAGKVIALGQQGSATGYYLPIYNLYGLTLAEVRFAPTPKTILEWIEKKQVAAGALSLAELERYRSNFSGTTFRILRTDSVPSGAILVGPRVERNQQEQIRKILESVSPKMAAAAGYIPNAKVPDYKNLIEVVQKVRPIAERIQQKPAPLYK